MASKFIVPLELPNFLGTPSSIADSGFVVCYIKSGWLTKKSPDGSENDLVLDRPLTGLSQLESTDEITEYDTVKTALEKLQQSILTFELTGGIQGTGFYSGGKFVMQTTIPNVTSFTCEDVAACEVITDMQQDITDVQTAIDNLATVATSGSYDDLLDTPTIPTLELTAPELTARLAAYGNRYEPGDVVFFEGNIYKCLLQNEGIPPTSTVYWQFLASGSKIRQQAVDWNNTTGDYQILNKPSTFPPDTHSHPISDITDLQTELDNKFDNPTGDDTQYIKGDGTLGTLPNGSQNLQEVLDVGNETITNIKLIDYTSIELDNGSLLRKGTYDFGNSGDVIINGITDAGDGFIAPISGWGEFTGTKWSDLNGTYIRTSVAVTPSGYSDGFQGMHTPEPGTYNYYLQLLGNPGLNGIAYFLAPGNRSGWGADPDDDANTDPSTTYWRLCVISDWPITYFTNPSTDPYSFPTEGWVPVDDTIPNSEGGSGYNYITGYDGGFTATFSNIINGGGGISRICSIGYEDMWQAGIRYVFGNSGTIREATNCFDYIPNNTFDINKRFAVGSRWVLDNGDIYVCTDNTSNAATWRLLTTTTGFEQNFLLMGA
jgi:hypothetical protein